MILELNPLKWRKRPASPSPAPALPPVESAISAPKAATPAPPKIQIPEVPAPAEESIAMATAPVTPVVAETTTQKIETFFSKFGHDLETAFNVEANIALEAEPTIAPLLPAQYQAGFIALVNAAAKQVAAADASYAKIGASTVPFATKVAQAVAVGGEGFLALAAQYNFTLATNMTTFFGAAATLSQSLSVASLTGAPVVPAATETAAP